MEREEMSNTEDYDNLLKELKTNSPYKRLPSPAKKWMSVSEMRELTDGVVYDLIKRNNIEVVIVDYWKRVPKKAFRKWYDGQSRYRTKEDKKKDAEMEAATLTMPEMSRQLGISRKQVYSILNGKKYKHLRISEERSCRRPDSEAEMEI